MSDHMLKDKQVWKLEEIISNARHIHLITVSFIKIAKT